jgi:hypothetical protein
LTTYSFKLSLLISLLLVGPTAFGQSATEVKHPLPATVESTSPDRGQLDGVNYTNNFFGLSLSIPPTWAVVSAQRSQTVAEQTSKLVSAEEKKKCWTPLSSAASTFSALGNFQSASRTTLL